MQEIDIEFNKKKLAKKLPIEDMNQDYLTGVKQINVTRNVV